MFLGHFAIGVATKPKAPKLPVWALFLAPQALDLFFLPLVALGIESFEQGLYGQDHIEAFYTHSLVGALLISALVFWFAKKKWKTNNSAWLLAGLSFSHWPIDLLVHHKDLPILPGNLGGFPLLGFGLWDYTIMIFSVEVILAILGVALYFSWAMKEKETPRWYIGPTAVAILFALMIMSDIPRLGVF